MIKPLAMTGEHVLGKSVKDGDLVYMQNVNTDLYLRDGGWRISFVNSTSNIIHLGSYNTTEKRY